MGVSIKIVEGVDMPDELKQSGTRWAYRVTSWDGTLHYFPNGELAARFAFKAHRVDRAQQGLDDDTEL
jgi:hypothetical protein